MISGFGPTSSPGMLIADGATDSDIATGYALSGYQADKLRSFCKATGLNYDDLWKTALIKDRINLRDPKQNLDLLSDQYKEILINELQTVKPNVVVPLSELSFNFLSGLKGIRKFRGSILPVRPDLGLKPTRVIPILGPHPYLSEDVKLEFITRLDFQKVAKNLYNDSIIKEVGTCWVCRTGSDFRKFIERHYGKAQYLVFDIETFVGIPTCISFCFDGEESVCCPLLDRGIEEDNRVIMLYEIIKLLKSPIPKVNQNIKFDCKKLERFGFSITNVIGDTMLAASCLYAEFPKNLGFLTSIYTDMPYFKDEGKEFDPSTYHKEKFYLYNAKDSLAVHKIYGQQIEEIPEMNLSTVYNMLVDIMSIYKEMEDNGIRIDGEQRERLLGKYISLYEIYVLKLHKLIGYKINPQSPLQIRKLVYEELKYKVVQGIKRTKAGEPSTDEDSLERLMWKSKSQAREGREILKTIIDCRKIHKVIELISLKPWPDGRLRCEYNLAGTETGRSSAGESTDYHLYYNGSSIKAKNLGHSFQTIGKHGFEIDGETYGRDIRSMFIPSAGYSFVECDLAQAEARVDMVLSNDLNMLPYFDNPGIHKLTGSWVFSCPPDEIKKNVLVGGLERYYVAKTVRHAGERNMQKERLMLMIHQPLSECEKILNIFHTKQPNIRRVFHRDVREQIQRYRTLIAPNGRRRDFFGKVQDGNVLNEAISFLPQAIVTDYIKQSLRKTYEEIQGWARFLAESHDSILSEVKEGREKEFGQIFKRNVEVDIDFRNCSLKRDYLLKIPCEVSIGKENWEDLEEAQVGETL